MAFLEHIAWMIFGMIFDIQLLKFVKLRIKETNEKQSFKMVPWKSANQNEDPDIPIRATAFSTATLIGSLIFFPLVFKTLLTGVGSMWYAFISISIWVAIQLPLILIFTIKHQRTKKIEKIKAQPPSRLQFLSQDEQTSTQCGLEFHDDNDEESIFCQDHESRFNQIHIVEEYELEHQNEQRTF